MPSTATKTTATTSSGTIPFLPSPFLCFFGSFYRSRIGARLRLKQDANASEIKKAYYKLSLKQWVPSALFVSLPLIPQLSNSTWRRPFLIMLCAVQPPGQEPRSGVAEALRQDRQCLRGMSWTLLPISVLLVVYVSSIHGWAIRGSQDLLSNSTHRGHSWRFITCTDMCMSCILNLAQLIIVTRLFELLLQNGLAQLPIYEICSRS